MLMCVSAGYTPTVCVVSKRELMLSWLNRSRSTWCVSLWNKVLGDLIKIFIVIFPLSLYFSLPCILLCFSQDMCQVVCSSFRREFFFRLWKLRTQRNQRQILIFLTSFCVSNIGSLRTIWLFPTQRREKIQPLLN